jgi:dTMP kinase
MAKETKDGKLIVIDGADGSGKATQTELLVEKLKEESQPVETIDFPQYNDNLLGELIGECLDGQHGEFTELDPKIVSILYAADRFESSPDIESWLDDGKVVVADRYVSSNQMHQGGKIDDPKKKQKFLAWLDELEYDLFGIPRPDAILYLDVPTPTTKQLLKENSEAMDGKRQYTRRRTDIVEEDEDYTKRSQSAAKEYVKERNKWHRIQCTKDGELMSKQAIHDKIYEKVTELISS